MTPEERENHIYLGDGVYAQYTPQFIILRANDHRDELCTDRIYLEGSVVANLILWLEKFKKQKGDQSE